MKKRNKIVSFGTVCAKDMVHQGFFAGLDQARKEGRTRIPCCIVQQEDLNALVRFLQAEPKPSQTAAFVAAICDTLADYAPPGWAVQHDVTGWWLVYD